MGLPFEEGIMCDISMVLARMRRGLRYMKMDIVVRADGPGGLAEFLIISH